MHIGAKRTQVEDGQRVMQSHAYFATEIAIYLHSQQVLYAVPTQSAPRSKQMSDVWLTR